MSASARSIALAVILRVTEHGGYSNLALRSALGGAGLHQADRDLATELTYGTLRRKLSLDWAIERESDRPVRAMTPRARALLRLGAYQLLFTRVPAHAAVSETVHLAGHGEKGFVNAVLRKLSAAPPEWPSGGADADVAVRTGLAPWAVSELRRIVGAPDVEAAASALSERPPVCIRTNPCRTTTDRLEAALRRAGLDPRRGGVHDGSLLIEGAAPSSLPGFDDGWFAVQDQASAFVVDALDPHPGEWVLDACAGPGGKAADIACRVADGGRLVAADVSATRSGLVRRTLGRLGVDGMVLAQDARNPAVRGRFDRVLVDAPCSGIGSARRRPELLWRPSSRDLSRLARLQVSIASAAADLLRPGGRLVYSVCTFPRAETDAACDALLSKRPDLEPASVEGPAGAAPRVRLWPHRDGTDAMFVAAFRRG
jgi:16S rRNA (cytosine967-C5)-methyltransferase